MREGRRGDVDLGGGQVEGDLEPQPDVGAGPCSWRRVQRVLEGEHLPLLTAWEDEPGAGEVHREQELLGVGPRAMRLERLHDDKQELRLLRRPAGDGAALQIGEIGVEKRAVDEAEPLCAAERRQLEHRVIRGRVRDGAQQHPGPDPVDRHGEGLLPVGTTHDHAVDGRLGDRLADPPRFLALEGDEQEPLALGRLDRLLRGALAGELGDPVLGEGPELFAAAERDPREGAAEAARILRSQRSERIGVDACWKDAEVVQAADRRSLLVVAGREGAEQSEDRPSGEQGAPSRGRRQARLKTRGAWCRCDRRPPCRPSARWRR